MKDKLTFDEEKHEYRLNGILLPNVTTILQEMGLLFFPGIENPLDRERNLKFGKAVHKATELWDKQDLDMNMLSQPLVPYLEQWIAFRKHFEVWDIEQPVYCKRWSFATTPDRTGIFKDMPTDCEIKTGNEYAPVTKLQTAGHLIALKERYPEKRFRKRIAVILSPDKYRIEEYKDKSDLEVFIACRQIYNFKKKNNLIR